MTTISTTNAFNLAIQIKITCISHLTSNELTNQSHQFPLPILNYIAIELYSTHQISFHQLFHNHFKWSFPYFLIKNHSFHIYHNYHFNMVISYSSKYQNHYLTNISFTIIWLPIIYQNIKCGNIIIIKRPFLIHDHVILLAFYSQ